jgi:hypothetical protein
MGRWNELNFLLISLSGYLLIELIFVRNENLFSPS